MDPRLRLRHLRCFLETARLESLSAAATALHVSQPAASKTIRELEDILGVPLFDRTGRRLVLTPSGKLFQQHAGGAMLALERAQSLARNAPERVTRLVVGILPTVATDVFPRAALAFYQDMLNCTLRVSTGPNWVLLSQLREGALDLTVGRMPNPGQMTGLAFQQLYSEQVVLVVRPGHPLTKTGAVAENLGKFPLVLPPGGAVIAPAVQSYLLSIGLQHAPAAFESVSLAFGRKVVQMSDAVWFISAGVVDDEIRQGSLRALDLGTSLMAGPVGICTRADTPPSPESTAMVAALQRLFSAPAPKDI